MLGGALRFFKEHDDILFIAHVAPDGDTLGSCLALYLLAQALGKSAQVVCEEPVPVLYRFLPAADQVLMPEEARQAEAVMCVDCADLARAGACRVFFDAAKYSFSVDHHDSNPGYAAGNYVRGVAATGELVYQVIRQLGVAISKDIATCLFAAIATDTGNFSYANTTADTFRVTAALMEAGIDLPTINRCLFRTTPFRKLKLLGCAITKIQLHCEGRLGMSLLTQADMRACEATSEDTEGIIDSIRDIDTVEVAVLLRESTDGLVRVSMRAKSAVDVGEIAVSLGGGGHRLAAGCTLDMPIEAAADLMRARIEAALSGDNA